MLTQVTDQEVIHNVEALCAARLVQDPGKDVTKLNFDALIANPNYDFKEVTPENSNALKEYNGVCDDMHIKVQLFAGMSHWFSVDVAFGEVRNCWKNHTPMGEKGMVSLTSIYTENAAFNFVYRVSLIKPKCRTVVMTQEYVASSNPIAYATILRHIVAEGNIDIGDWSEGEWDTARIGWGE